LECSFVSVPADPGATVTARSAARACPWPEQGSAMPAAARRFDPVYFSAAGRFSSLAEQLRAIARYERDGGEPDHRLVRAATGAAETDPTAGGFLVQQDFAETLIGSIYEQSEIAQRCDRRQTDFPGRDCLVPAVDETSRADGSRWGGVASYWVAEAASISSSFPKFRRVAFNPQKIIAVVYGTGELHEDVPMFDAHLRRALASELVFQLDKAVLLGSAGTPLGVTNAGCTIQVAKETGQASGTILLENVDKMWTRLPAPCRRRATWFCCEDAEAQLG
jgi:HK97 family phage major capsid protein